jgi:hypothetical protein
VIERQNFGGSSSGVRIGEGSLYDWVVEEIVTANEAELAVDADTEVALQLLGLVRERRRSSFQGLVEAAFDQAIAADRTRRTRRHRRAR